MASNRREQRARTGQLGIENRWWSRFAMGAISHTWAARDLEGLTSGTGSWISPRAVPRHRVHVVLHEHETSRAEE